jgi:hypothetical protein
MTANKETYYRQLAIDLKNNQAISKKYLATVLVEAEDDKIFWKKIFDHFLPNHPLNFIFEIKTPEEKMAQGCLNCLRFHELGCLSKEFFICIDSDYRRLLQEPDLDIEHFVFQTYTYSFENHFCYPRNINNTIGKLGLKNNLFDFESFLQKYSSALYELFICHILSLQKKDNVLNASDFNPFIGLNVCSLNEELLISELQNRVEIKLLELKSNYAQSEIEHLKNICRNLGLTEYNAYLYFRGHNVFDQLVVKIIKELVNKLEQNSSQTYTNEERQQYFSRERKTIGKYLEEDIHFDKYDEINKIKADAEKYKQLYS